MWFLMKYASEELLICLNGLGDNIAANEGLLVYAVSSLTRISLVTNLYEYSTG